MYQHIQKSTKMENETQQPQIKYQSISDTAKKKPLSLARSWSSLAWSSRAHSKQTNTHEVFLISEPTRTQTSGTFPSDGWVIAAMVERVPINYYYSFSSTVEPHRLFESRQTPLKPGEQKLFEWEDPRATLSKDEAPPRWPALTA